MIVGDQKVFAIESEFIKAYEQLSLRALGFFNIYILGIQYGVKAQDATMLACSLDEIKKRLEQKGQHTVSFAKEKNAGKIADAFRDAYYNENHKSEYFGILHKDFIREVDQGNIVWAPDGDSAFDDGSYILQFDIDEQVRIIGFRSDGYKHLPMTLSDILLPESEFYAILTEWHLQFMKAWQDAIKQ